MLKIVSSGWPGGTIEGSYTRPGATLSVLVTADGNPRDGYYFSAEWTLRFGSRILLTTSSTTLPVRDLWITFQTTQKEFEAIREELGNRRGRGGIVFKRGQLVAQRIPRPRRQPSPARVRGRQRSLSVKHTPLVTSELRAKVPRCAKCAVELKLLESHIDYCGVSTPNPIDLRDERVSSYLCPQCGKFEERREGA